MINTEKFNITNYSEHPADNRYVVFQFKEIDKANHFEKLINEKSIWYEKNEEEEHKVLFGVKKQDYKEALNANFLTFAKYRKPFMADKPFRYVVLFITITVLAVACWGYFTHK